jgi:hypothetical protein
MITYQSSSLLKRAWIWALLVGMVFGGLLWWWQSRALAVVVDGEQAASNAGIIKSTPEQSVLVPLPQPTLDGAKPDDFSAEEWAALKDAMSRTENPKQELARVVAYLRFQKGFERWQNLQNSPDVLARRMLAAQLFKLVPERLQHGELSMGEAILIQGALLNDMEPDDNSRQQRLIEAQKELAAAAPQANSDDRAHDAALLAEYKRREAAILADYQAKPEGSRDTARLEEDLEAARRAVYSAQ